VRSGGLDDRLTSSSTCDGCDVSASGSACTGRPTDARRVCAAANPLTGLRAATSSPTYVPRKPLLRALAQHLRARRGEKPRLRRRDDGATVWTVLHYQ
jgi:hypothetical protein